MDEEFKTLDVSGSEHDRMMAEKDAEIERLKEARDLYFKGSSDQALEITDLKVLITELADTLVMESPAFDVDYSNLIKRAREATKE